MDGQEARVTKQPPGYLEFSKGDPICFHFSLKSTYL